MYAGIKNTVDNDENTVIRSKHQRNKNTVIKSKIRLHTSEASSCICHASDQRSRVCSHGRVNKVEQNVKMAVTIISL